jgi:hypothetical protein
MPLFYTYSYYRDHRPRPPFIHLKSGSKSLNFFPQSMKATVFKCTSIEDVLQTLHFDFGCNMLPVSCKQSSSTYMGQLVTPGACSFFNILVNFVNANNECTVNKQLCAIAYEPELFNSVYFNKPFKCIVTNTAKVIFLGVTSDVALKHVSKCFLHILSYIFESAYK